MTDPVTYFRTEPSNLCYGCACGASILVGFEKAAGWKRCMMLGAIVWVCPGCMRNDPSLKPVSLPSQPGKGSE